MDDHSPEKERDSDEGEQDPDDMDVAEIEKELETDAIYQQILHQFRMNYQPIY